MASSSRRILFGIVLFLVTCGFLGALFAQKNPSVAPPNSDSDVRDNVKNFTQVYSIVEENYAEKVDRRQGHLRRRHSGHAARTGPAL